METISKVPRSPQKSKDLVETVEHYKNLKPDHVPIGIVQALSLASSKNTKIGFSPIKSVKLQSGNGKETNHPVVPRPDNAWNYEKQRLSYDHLTKNIPCFCGAGRDISFLYDAKIIEDRSKPLSAIAKSREVKPVQSKLSELGTKTPTIDDDFATETLIPEEYHVVQMSGVHQLQVKESGNTTLTDEHEHHLTVFPSLKPTSRKEVIQLMETMELLLAEAGCTDDIPQVESTEIHNLLNLIKKEQHIYNVVFHELIRQVTVQCKDRGKLLAKVREYYQKLLDKIPRQIMSLHQEVMAQRALDRRLTDELIKFKTAIATLSTELNEVREHDQEVTQQALEAQKDLASALSESEKNANLVAEYHSLYEIQRKRLEFQITTLNKERDLWSRAVYDLAVKVSYERNLRTARRLQLCEQTWTKLAGHFTLVLADTDSKSLQELQTAVNIWRNKVESFSNELDGTDASIKEKLEQILQEVVHWKEDLNERIRPTGKVEIPEDYPVQRLFECCRMWEEMLSVLVERFNGDSLLAYEEDITNLSRRIDFWKDLAIKIFSHHPHKDEHRHPCHEAMLDLDRCCEDLLQQLHVRVTGENALGVARGIMSLVAPIESWGNRLMQITKGNETLNDSEWTKLFSNLMEWSHTITKVLSRLKVTVVIKEEDDITTIPPSIMEFNEFTDCSDSARLSASVAKEDNNSPSKASDDPSIEEDVIDLEYVLTHLETWLRDTNNTIDNENSVIIDRVSILHNDMIKWTVTMILELTKASSLGEEEGEIIQSQSVDSIGGTVGKLCNFEESGGHVCNKLREFTASILRCCNDIILDRVSSSDEMSNTENEYKDLKRLESECEEWIKTANVLIQEALEEKKTESDEVGTKDSVDEFKGPEAASQQTISSEESKPKPTAVKGEDSVFVLGDDENIQPSTVDEILSRHSTPSSHLELGLSSVPGQTGNPLSDAETHVNLVNELNIQVQETLNKAKVAEERIQQLEEELAEAKGKIVDLEKQVEEEKSKHPPPAVKHSAKTKKRK